MLESKIEEFEFRNRFFAEELEDRTTHILSRAEELDKELKDEDSIKKHFQELKAYEPQNKGFNLDEMISLVYLVCKRTVGQEWNILGNNYKWDLVPRDVQIQAGIILCENSNNRFIRARTGEGKTLVSLFPLAYHSMLGNVHSITANDYLAERDSQWIGPILNKLGITTSFLPKNQEENPEVSSELPKENKKAEAYKVDVVFGSDKEFSFDFLRDSIRSKKKPKLCTKRDYALIDEADHIMLDELRTPIILSALTDYSDPAVEIAHEAVGKLLEKQKELVSRIQSKSGSIIDNKEYLNKLLILKYSGVSGKWLNRMFAEKPSLSIEVDDFENNYVYGKEFFKHIEPYLLFTVYKNRNACSLTEKGEEFIEENFPELKELFLLPDYEAIKRTVRELDAGRYYKTNKITEWNKQENMHLGLLSAIKQSLYANILLEKDIDYMVKDDKVNIINSSIGRAEPSKKYQKGLSQAVEIKEKLEPSEVNITLTETTFPGLLSNYKRTVSMSGTLPPNQKEMAELYGIESFDVPTNKPMIAKHFKTKLFKTKDEKRSALLEDIKYSHGLGRPILIGTGSVKDSEQLAKLLDKHELNYNLLNAKNEKEEAGIISKAGSPNAITISTSMAGRGTDIKVEDDVNRKIAERFVKSLSCITGAYQSIRINYYSDNEKKILLSELENQKVNFDITNRHVLVYGTRSKEQLVLDFNLGLYVIGEELGVSERVNSQLRGRTGRQGQPGSSRFYSSLEDDIVKDSAVALWLGTKAMSKNNFLTPVLKKLSLLIAQDSSETNSKYERSEALFYGSIVEKQRKLTSDFREKVIDGNLSSFTPDIIENVVSDFVNESFKTNYFEQKDFENFKYFIEQTANTNFSSFQEQVNNLSRSPDFKKELKDLAYEHLMGLYGKRAGAFGNEKYSKETDTMIDVLDSAWLEQIEILESLKENASLQSYAGKEPKLAYAKLAHESFDRYKSNVMKNFLKDLFYLPLPQELKTRQKSSSVSDELGELLDTTPK